MGGEDEDEEVEGWVSEPCVKAIILSLLTAIANSAENEAIAKGPHTGEPGRMRCFAT